MEDLFQQHLDYWRVSADRDLKMAETLFNGKNYNYSLFFLHLSIEKLLKGLVLKLTKEPALPIHDLRKLFRMSGLVMDDELNEQLREITSFNISARYDDYKQEFYKRATHEFTTKWFGIGKKIVEFLLKKYE